MSAAAVEFSRVSKSYSIYPAPGDRLKELATFNRRSFHTDYWALRDVSLQVNRGETFCVVGENGSGKSTLLQICAGILQPTAGQATVNGRVAALLELGAGFNPEFSGRDNVYLNGAILGLSAKEMDRRFPEIEAFAEIGDFIQQPVKTYSSGMVVRLAFAVAIHLDPEILLVDEALSVGDIYFRQRCMRKVHELRARGITILFVTHATSDVKAIGDRALWLDHGRVMAMGKTDLVVTKYLAAMAAKDAQYLAHGGEARSPIDAGDYRAPAEVVTDIPNIDHRFGDRRAELLGIAICDESGQICRSLAPNSTIVVRISARAKANLDRPIIGFMFRNHLGVDFAGTNTAREGCPLAAHGGGRSLHGRLLHPLAGALRIHVFLFTRCRRRISRTLCDLRLDRQRCRVAHGPAGSSGLRALSFSVPRGNKLPDRSGSGRTVTEFTGERVIPGEVEDDLWAEHVARYAFASRFAEGKRALDLGCGAGYGTAELAHRARFAVGIDVAADAVHYARAHYPAASFLRASAAAQPFADGSFDLITAFEVIEHLAEWKAMLAETRRVLGARGIFLVSTPNKLYYAESRAKNGPNPFHAHEFEFSEFRDALAEFFPRVNLLLQNRLESFAFSPAKPAYPPLDARVDGDSGAPEEAHFFLAICSIHALPELRSFLYVPRASNLLRERERHIRKLDDELAQTKQWLDGAIAERDSLIGLHAEQTRHLEEHNRWALKLDSDWKAALQRVSNLQDELQANQAAATEAVESYERVVANLQEESRRRAEWALETEQRLSTALAGKGAELAEAVRLLDAAEATVVERTLWAQNLQARLDRAEQQLWMIRDSRWLKLGRAAGLGPRLEG